MTIGELLTEMGHPLGRGGRTSCPIHRGDNPGAFHYEDTRWHCFSGCGGGGLASLRKALGMTPVFELPPPTGRPGGFEGLEGLYVDDFFVPQGRRLTDQLTQWGVEASLRRSEWAALRHRNAMGALREVELGVALGRQFSGLRGLLSAFIEDRVGEWRAGMDLAHSAWGDWPWPCGCYEGTNE